MHWTGRHWGKPKVRAFLRDWDNYLKILALFGSLICKPYSEGSSEMSLSSLFSFFLYPIYM